jgi:HAD superfamily hydrolase (TIGR01509 family)
MLKGIIFDFDGVIADTEKKKFEDIKKILSKNNLKIVQSDFPDFIGKKTDFYIKQKFPNLPKDKLNKILAERKKLQFKNLKKNKLLPGIILLLKYIKSEKYKIALVTGSKKRFVKKILIMYNILKYFDAIITGEDFKTSKPNPECYKKALKKTGLKPSEVIIIEDSPAGISAGKRINAKVFAVETYLDKTKFNMADKSFKNSFEILKSLKKGN